MSAFRPALIRKLSRLVDYATDPKIKPYVRGMDRLLSLANYRQQAPNLGVAHNVVFIGDSTLDDETSSKTFFLNGASSGLPYGGAGFLSFFNGDSAIASQSILPERVSCSWTTSHWTNNTSTNTYGPAGVDVVSTGNGSLITVRMREWYTSVDLLYLRQSGGGQFRYRVAGGSWTTVSTANASRALGTETISISNSLTVAPVDFNIEIEALAAGVSLAGLICKTSPYAFNCHSCAATGNTAGTFGQDATLFASGMAALGANTAVIMFGINELVSQVPLATFKTNLQRIITALPAGCNVLLMAPHETKYETEVSPGGPLRQKDYSGAMWEVCEANPGRCAFIDWATIVGTFSQTLVDAGIMHSDRIHLAAAGKRMQGQTLTRLLGIAPDRANIISTAVDYIFPPEMRGDHLVLANTQYGSIKVTLPDATLSRGCKVTLCKEYDDANTLTGAPIDNTQSVNENTSLVLVGSKTRVTVVSDGDDWHVLSFSPFAIEPVVNDGQVVAKLPTLSRPSVFLRSLGGTLVNPTWSASGTLLGLTARNDFAGDLIHFGRLGSSLFKVDYTGNVYIAGGITTPGFNFDLTALGKLTAKTGLFSNYANGESALTASGTASITEPIFRVMYSGILRSYHDSQGVPFGYLPTSSPSNANFIASTWTAYIDGDNLTFKVLKSDGTTFKTGTVALT